MDLIRRRQLGVLAVSALFALGGCQHLGPRSILQDRIPYNEAISESWKQQTLLNVVRLRYADLPEFIDVPSILGGYGLDRTTSGNFGLSVSDGLAGGWAQSYGLGGARTLSDRPTITFSPQTGSSFTRNLITPIAPAAILNLIESGNPADLVLDLGVESINGIRNRQNVGGKVQEADPEFQLVGQIMQKAQASGHVSLRLRPAKDKQDPDVVFAIRDNEIDPALAAELVQLRTILRLDPVVSEFKVVLGMLPQAKDEIAFRTRSVMRVLTYLTLNVQVPVNHLADGRAPDLGDHCPTTQPQLTVHSGCKMPCDSYAAVLYQGYWFWIDQRDFNSKRSMAYLKILLALADTGPKEAPPALTIRGN